MTLEEILAALAEFVGDDEAKVKDVARSLRSTDGTKPIASVIYNAGAASKKGETTTKVKELTDQVTTLTEERNELTQQLEAAKAKPDEHQVEWDRQKKKLEERATKAEGELKLEREGRVGDRVGHVAGRVAGHLKGHVDDEYLSEVLTPKISKRVRPADGGKIELLGGDETPLDGEGEVLEKALATEMLKAVPDKFRLRNLQAGGGVSGGGTGTTAVTREQVDTEKANSGSYRM